MAKGAKKKERGKKQKKPQKPMQQWKLYEAKGETIVRKNKFCPKCGTGFFLAQHKNRSTCGHCGYTEFVSKAPKEAEKKQEEKKPADKKPEPKKEEKKPAEKKE